MIKKIIIAFTLAFSLIPSYAAATPARDAARKKWDAMNREQRAATYNVQEIWNEFKSLSGLTIAEARITLEEAQDIMREEKTIRALLIQDPTLNYKKALQRVQQATPAERQQWIDECQKEEQRISERENKKYAIHRLVSDEMYMTGRYFRILFTQNPALDYQEAQLLITQATFAQKQQWIDEVGVHLCKELASQERRMIDHVERVLMQHPELSYQEARLLVHQATRDQKLQWIDNELEEDIRASKMYQKIKDAASMMQSVQWQKQQSIPYIKGALLQNPTWNYIQAQQNVAKATSAELQQWLDAHEKEELRKYQVYRSSLNKGILEKIIAPIIVLGTAYCLYKMAPEPIQKAVDIAQRLYIFYITH